MHPALNIAIKAARRAGQIINRASHDLDLLKVETKQPNDFVTEVDRKAEAAIIETLREAVAAQGQRSRVRWADALSISVRPVITYWFMALYCAAKTAAFVGAMSGGADWGAAILHAWTEADQALWAGVLNFWFLGRVFDRVRA